MMAKEHKLSFPTAPARSTITHVGVAALFSRMKAASPETEKPLIRQALGALRGRGQRSPLYVLTDACSGYSPEAQ